MPTLDTQTNAYVSVEEFLKRYDRRMVGQFVSDEEEEVSAANLATDPVLLAMLQDGAGLIDMHATTGGRYSTADLAAMTGNAKRMLERLNSDLSFQLLSERRGYREYRVPTRYKDARDLLDRLRSGEAIFSFEEAKRAGRITPGTSLRQIIEAYPSTVSLHERFFGQRSSALRG